jgi:hypothetical protein
MRRVKISAFYVSSSSMNVNYDKADYITDARRPDGLRT